MATTTSTTQDSKTNFSKEEIENYIQMGIKIAGKSVLSVLKEMLSDATPDNITTEERNNVIEELISVIPKEEAHVSLSFSEFKDPLLLKLHPVQKNFIAEVKLPAEEYKKALIEQWTCLLRSAVSFWKQFTEMYPELFEKICNILPNVDLSNLQFDCKGPTLFFDEHFKYRIGIQGFYRDRQGNLYIPRNKT